MLLQVRWHRLFLMLLLADRRRDYQLRATGSVLKFEGFLKLSDKKDLLEDKDKTVPYLEAKTPVELYKLLPAEQHFTEPPVALY